MRSGEVRTGEVRPGEMGFKVIKVLGGGEGGIKGGVGGWWVLLGMGVPGGTGGCRVWGEVTPQVWLKAFLFEWGM